MSKKTWQYNVHAAKIQINISANKNFFSDETDICEALYKDIRLLPGGNILYYYIKPLLRGKVFYTPDNYITQRIITHVSMRLK